MTSPEIRTIQPDELRDYMDVMSTAFLDRPDVGKIADEVRELWPMDRTWAAFDRGAMCGTFRSFPTQLTVPGGAQIPASAVAAVTVLPTHRRRGVLRGMAAAEHQASRDRGEAASLLYASEFMIYGRIGYGPAVREATWTIDAARTSFHGAAAERVELVRPSAETREEMKGVFRAWRLTQAGEIERRDYRWDFDLALRPSNWGPDWKGFLAFHRATDGTVDGYVRYRAEEKWEQRQPRNVLNIDELHALSDEAYAALWRFLVDVDLVSTVKAEHRSPGERLPWLLTNHRAAVVSDVGDGMWVRLLDLPRALEARAYERAGRVVLEVVDEEAPGGRTRVELDVSAEGARCRTTDRSPDLTFYVSALGAAYLGGTPLKYAAVTRGVDEHRAGALAEADALLRTLEEPWTSTFF